MTGRQGRDAAGLRRLRQGLLRLRPGLVLMALLSASCAGLARNDQGNLQPQTVDGPCQVKKFFILRTTSTPTEMTVGPGPACRLTIFNPNLQIALNAALVTEPPAHGRATAELISGRRQAEISYEPQPGYTGPDRFSVTLQPDAWGMRFAVTVQASPPAP